MCNILKKYISLPLICLENQANQVKIKIVFMKRIIVLASLFLVIGFNASAEGYQVNLQSSKQAGMGHAGAALKLGAESMFIDKYGDIVTLYKIGDISLEFCGGPHVSNTNELGHFKIIKEEASSQGVRRIKGILE